MVSGSVGARRSNLLYAISGRDAPNSLGLRMQARGAHLARVSELHQAGRLIIAGPYPALDTREPGSAGYTGSLIVADFESLDDATTWARGDPYLAAGAWLDVDVRPFVQVLP
jgi:uncharacterized protein